jgi:starch-binding outer membrane protein, SusD/RagB family
MKKIFYLFIAVSVLAVGCKKSELNTIPQTFILEKDAFSTPDRVLNEVMGVYSGVKNGNFLGGRGIVYNDVRGEDWLNITGNGVTALGVWNFSITSTDNQTEGFWGAGFNAINRANLVLDGIDANASSIPVAVANRFRGEARFCRALSYFYLVNLYGKAPYNSDGGASAGLPLRLVGNKTANQTAMARSTVNAVYRQMITDLNFAEANLPLSYAGSADSNVVRAHRNAAIALKTRVFLHMGKYDSVIYEANKIVSAAAPFTATTGVGHRLSTTFLTIFRAPYTELESIFSFPMANTNPPGTQNGLSLYHNAEFAINPTGIFADATWGANDARKQLVTTAATRRYTKFNDDLTNYVPIIRYAEVLLNLAEALARQNGLDARAIAILNAVRQRSDPSVTLAPASQAALINAILTERRIELLGEGFRSLDIMRLVQTFPAKGSVTAVPPGSQVYVWPIPATELLYNSLMTPN